MSLLPDEPMGLEINHGSWNNPYPTQLTFGIGGRNFLFGHNSSGYWFIQELSANGTMGSETDRGSWKEYYASMFAFQVGGRTFIYGQNANERNWFIQEVLDGGKMGNETDHGGWGEFYEAQVSFEAGGRSFFYGQNADNKNWFIQELRPDGKMGTETDHGGWAEFYRVQFTFECAGRTFLYGQNENDLNWFIQELLSNGKMGVETDHGKWNNFYLCQFGYNINGSQYLYGQNQNNNYWFIQGLVDGGKIGPELLNGGWNNPYPICLPFQTTDGKTFFYGSKQSPDYDWFTQELHEASLADPFNWMSDHLSQIGGRTLMQIAMPASHDAGMSETQKCNLGTDCNTQTQTRNILDQLRAGSRYFDIRPVYKDATFYTGHFSYNNTLGYLGCCGQSLADVLSNVGAYLSQGGRDLVILKLSHFTDLDSEGDSGFSSETTRKLLTQVTTALKGSLYIGEVPAAGLQSLKVADFIGAGGKVLVVVDGLDAALKSDYPGVYSYADKPDPSQPFPRADLIVFDQYAGMNTVAAMSKDQLSKLANEANHDRCLFLLSWTLTQSNSQAVGCQFTSGSSILDLAQEANIALGPELENAYQTNIIPRNLRPNLVYVDNVNRFHTDCALWLNEMD